MTEQIVLRNEKERKKAANLKNVRTRLARERIRIKKVIKGNGYGSDHEIILGPYCYIHVPSTDWGGPLAVVVRDVETDKRDFIVVHTLAEMVKEIRKVISPKMTSNYPLRNF